MLSESLWKIYVLRIHMLVDWIMRYVFHCINFILYHNLTCISWLAINTFSFTFSPINSISQCQLPLHTRWTIQNHIIKKAHTKETQIQINPQAKMTPILPFLKKKLNTFINLIQVKETKSLNTQTIWNWVEAQDLGQKACLDYDYIPHNKYV